MLHSLFKEVISTALVGTNSLFREGVRGILHAPYQVETVSETIDALQQVGELDLVILIADKDQSALPAQVRRAKEIAGARVVVVSDVDTSDVVWSLLAAGANGHLLRSISPEAMRASLEAVMLGGTVVLPAPRKPFVIECADSAGLDKGVVEAELPKPDAEAEYKKLSDRETEILLRLTKGESNKQIARKFEITEATVKVHLKAILRKIRVSNRTQAAVWAHYNYVARSSHLTQAALADFRQDASRGPGVRKKFMTPHEDRVRQNIGVQEGALIVADSVN